MVNLFQAVFIQVIYRFKFIFNVEFFFIFFFCKYFKMVGLNYVKIKYGLLHLLLDS